MSYRRPTCTSKEKVADGRGSPPILDVALETTGLSKAQLKQLLDPTTLTKGGVHGGSAGG